MTVIIFLRFSAGIAWSFRFASQKKKMVIANLPHLDIREWLQRLELLSYEDNFRKYFGVEEMINLNESDIRDLGVKNSAHRARMISSLVALKGELCVLLINFQRSAEIHSNFQTFIEYLKLFFNVFVKV